MIDVVCKASMWDDTVRISGYIDAKLEVVRTVEYKWWYRLFGKTEEEYIEEEFKRVIDEIERIAGVHPRCKEINELSMALQNKYLGHD